MRSDSREATNPPTSTSDTYSGGAHGLPPHTHHNPSVLASLLLFRLATCTMGKSSSWLDSSVVGSSELWDGATLGAGICGGNRYILQALSGRMGRRCTTLTFITFPEAALWIFLVVCDGP